MFLKKLEDFDHSTPGKNKRIKTSKILLFAVLVIVGIVFSSLTEAESATIFNSSTNSSSFSGGNDGLLTINSK